MARCKVRQLVVFAAFVLGAAPALAYTLTNRHITLTTAENNAYSAKDLDRVDVLTWTDGPAMTPATLPRTGVTTAMTP